MGGNKQKFFSFFSFFKAKKGRKDQDHSYSVGQNVWSTRNKGYESDEKVTLGVVADPGIDKKASIFITDFHASCVSQSIHHHQAGLK
ncbi:hypothetical protein CRYUN_Cryun22dG0028800 [Craigia yunnanensis]